MTRPASQTSKPNAATNVKLAADSNANTLAIIRTHTLTAWISQKAPNFTKFSRMPSNRRSLPALITLYNKKPPSLNAQTATMAASKTWYTLPSELRKPNNASVKNVAAYDASVNLSDCSLYATKNIAVLIANDTTSEISILSMQ